MSGDFIMPVFIFCLFLYFVGAPLQAVTVGGMASMVLGYALQVLGEKSKTKEVRGRG